MFFIMGITEGRKDFDFLQSIVCSVCGRYGQFQVFMTYTVLSLFFIPCFKWNKHYYVRTTCCDTLYELDPEVGKRIAKGEIIEIRPEHLQRVGNGSNDSFRSYKTCANCGYTTDEDFQFCPKCGREF